jgi:hypothetical protein
MALAFEADADKLLAAALARREEWQREAQAEVARLETEVRRLERREAARQAGKLQRALLPDQSALNSIMRYEGHLTRQLLQSLHTLEWLQRAQAGEPVPAPAALDVTVSNEEALALPSTVDDGPVR